MRAPFAGLPALDLAVHSGTALAGTTLASAFFTGTIHTGVPRAGAPLVSTSLSGTLLAGAWLVERSCARPCGSRSLGPRSLGLCSGDPRSGGPRSGGPRLVGPRSVGSCSLSSHACTRLTLKPAQPSCTPAATMGLLSTALRPRLTACGTEQSAQYLHCASPCVVFELGPSDYYPKYESKYFRFENKPKYVKIL